MATPHDADLIIKLYQLRTEETMRKARSFFVFEFFPQSADDVRALFGGNQENPDWNHYFRQVTSYWDMAAAMVNHGAIDKDLFLDTNGEFIAIWAKIGDFVPELRQFFGPQYLVNLEKLIAAHPNGQQRVQMMKDRYAAMAAARASKQAAQ